MTTTDNVRLSHPDSLAKLRNTLRQTTRQILSPPRKIKLSDWSDENIVLGLTSAEPGQWRTDRAPYQREILDTMGSYEHQKVVLMTSAQIGKTGCLLNLAAFHMKEDPAPIMIVQPSKQMAENFSTSKLTPVLNESPGLRTLVASTRKRDGGNKVLSKTFPGGGLYMVGAQSASALRSLSIRVLLADEIDAYPPDVDDEGDPLRLAIARTITYPNRKIILCSTPTIKDFSRIETEYLGGDQRTFHVPCPHCGAYQRLVFGGREYTHGLKWQHHDASTAVYQCEHCHDFISESHKLQMMLHGQWIAANPDGKYPSFHVSALYSPWTRWADIVEEWLECHGTPDKRRSFVNLKLGEPFEDKTNLLETSDLAAHCHSYPAEVPPGVGVITCGIDVQQDWIECHAYGWGIGEEGWYIDSKQLVGNTTQQDVWDQLDIYLRTTYTTPAGGRVPIRISAIDTGAFTEMVNRQVLWLKSRGHHIVPTKGFDGSRAVFEWSLQKKQGQAKLGIIGSSQAKEILFSRLRGVTNHGPGFIHYPATIPLLVLEGITSEKKITVYGKGNAPKTMWKQMRDRNEPLDCLVYSFAILHSLGKHILQEMPALVDAVSALTGDVPDLTATSPDGTQSTGFEIKGLKTRPSLIGSSWLSR
ncbi:MAG TPA: terminase gpA endonuclease subunit [Gemmatimonadales bacterium]|jgi:phage terminase large subunit GpA-like protein